MAGEMKKLFLSLAVIFGFGWYALAIRPHGRDHSLVITPSNSPSVPSTTLPDTNSTAPPSNNQTTNQTYRNGSFIGSVADAFYGNIQVKAIISGGQITDVQFLQYPNDRQNSIEINSQAMPYLKSEAIQVQDANVDIISGATATSLAFQQSLASALRQAKS